MNKIQELKEEYERKADNLDVLLRTDLTISGRQLARFVGYRRLYREFAHELGRLMPEEANQD